MEDSKSKKKTTQNLTKQNFKGVYMPQQHTP